MSSSPFPTRSESAWQVLAASQPKPPGATIPTLIGPFFIDDAPVFPIGADIAGGASGQPLYAYGRVLDTRGEPVSDAILNVWQSDDRGLYDVQDNFDPEKMWGRGRIKCDPEGRYAFWSVMPTAYPAPMDAALGDLIRNTTGRYWRPAHLHFAVETKTADALATHIFVRGSEHIDCDVAFGVRPALITDFTEHAPGVAPDGREMNGALSHAELRLRPDPVRSLTGLCVGWHFTCSRPGLFKAIVFGFICVCLDATLRYGCVGGFGVSPAGGDRLVRVEARFDLLDDLAHEAG